MTDRDAQAESGHAEFTGWMHAQGYNPDLTMICSNFGPGDLRDAFAAGMQAERDLAAAHPQAAPDRDALEIAVAMWESEADDITRDDAAQAAVLRMCADQIRGVLGERHADGKTPAEMLAESANQSLDLLGQANKTLAEVAAARDAARAECDRLRDLLNEASIAEPAPELRAAMEDTGRIYALAAGMHGSFREGPDGWWHARVTARVIRRWGAVLDSLPYGRTQGAAGLGPGDGDGNVTVGGEGLSAGKRLLSAAIDEIATVSYAEAMTGTAALLAALAGAVLARLGIEPDGKADVIFEADETVRVTVAWPAPLTYREGPGSVEVAVPADARLPAQVDAEIARAVAAERARIIAAAEGLKITLSRPGNGPAQRQETDVVPLAALRGLLSAETDGGTAEALAHPPGGVAVLHCGLGSACVNGPGDHDWHVTCQTREEAAGSPS